MTTTVFCLKGNELFKKTEFEGALDLYNQAIHSCPPHRREYNTYKLDTCDKSKIYITPPPFV